MGIIKLIGSGLNKLGETSKHVGKFISDNGGSKAWNAVSPHLKKAANFVGEDISDISSGLKWAGRKALDAVKAANDFDDNYLGGAVKSKLAGMATDYVGDRLKGINNTTSLVKAGTDFAKKHLGRMKGIFSASNKGTGGTSIGSTFKDLSSANPYPSVYGMSHL